MSVRKAVVIVPYFIENGEKKFLVLERAIHWTGWEFPKGGIDEGEVDEQSAIRELREETGLTPKTITRMPDTIVYYYFREGQKVRSEQNVFLVEVSSNDVTISHEHKSFKWLIKEEAVKQLTWKDQKELLKTL